MFILFLTSQICAILFLIFESVLAVSNIGKLYELPLKTLKKNYSF